MLDKMIRAARLEASLYEEVERDENATTEAMIVVIIVSLLTGIGTGLGALLQEGPAFFIGALASGIVGALIRWIVAAILTYWVGTGLFGGTATVGELLRTIGYAQAPGALGILAFIPICGGLILLAVSIWVLVAIVVAIRQALDFTTGRAVATGVVAYIAWIVISILFALLFGAFGAIFS